ncbi:hypothetical protein FB192DRAFT_1357809 [Mucor lusitanicus]|uniref:Uncharacterized protein n=1 Tax=Mucor circinelloides f. lusitanicus TaxID=29924 RepID=A0A8H4F4A7_MUCCL|nr:hypothetical protein FB192DRAFT_1357809 [Mucor lusitanicus]
MSVATITILLGAGAGGYTLSRWIIHAVCLLSPCLEIQAAMHWSDTEFGSAYKLSIVRSSVLPDTDVRLCKTVTP